MIPPVKQTRLDRMVENIKALGLDKTPVHFYSTDFTKGHILTVHDDKRGEEVAIGTIKDFWHPELFSSAPELALEVQRLRKGMKMMLDDMKFSKPEEEIEYWLDTWKHWLKELIE